MTYPQLLLDKPFSIRRTIFIDIFMEFVSEVILPVLKILGASC